MTSDFYPHSPPGFFGFSQLAPQWMDAPDATTAQTKTNAPRKRRENRTVRDRKRVGCRGQGATRNVNSGPLARHGDRPVAGSHRIKRNPVSREKGREDSGREKRAPARESVWGFPVEFSRAIAVGCSVVSFVDYG